MSHHTHCPACGQQVPAHKNPVPTVDVVIFFPPQSILLIERKNFPQGWALPGGFVDYGEKAETAAVREAKEETGLDVVLTDLLGVYSHPGRDPRLHTLSVVYTAVATTKDINAGDDAGKAVLFDLNSLPEMAFDHHRIVSDFLNKLNRLG